MSEEQRQTLGWRVVGLIKQKDGTRSLGYIHPKLLTVKSVAEEIVAIANQVDPELKPYLVQVTGHEGLLNPT